MQKEKWGMLSFSHRTPQYSSVLFVCVWNLRLKNTFHKKFNLMSIRPAFSLTVDYLKQIIRKRHPPSSCCDSCFMSYHLESQLVSIRVQWWHQVDPHSVHQAAHSRVVVIVLFAQKLHQQQEKLSTQGLITMKTSCVTKFRFTWKQNIGADSLTRSFHWNPMSGIKILRVCRHAHLAEKSFIKWNLLKSRPVSCSPGLSEISMAYIFRPCELLPML